MAARPSGPALPTLARSPPQGAPPASFPTLTIPTPHIASYNVNGLSGEATDGASKARQTRMLQNVQALARSSQFLGLQDTRCRDSSPVFDLLLPTTHTTFHNPNPDSLHCGGTALLVPKSLLPQYRISHHIIVAGWVQALDFRPRDPHAADFTLLNVYLKSNNQAMAISSLSAIKDTQKGKSNLFAFGDWNMTQHRSDSSGAKDHFASTPALRKEFEDTLDKLGLPEIYQGSHTRVSSHQGSSRLDRIYTSLSLAEKCVTVPWS